MEASIRLPVTLPVLLWRNTAIPTGWAKKTPKNIFGDLHGPQHCQFHFISVSIWASRLKL